MTDSPFARETFETARLSQENQALKGRVLELEYKLGIFGDRSRFSMTPPETVEVPAGRILKRIATVDSRITPGYGLEVIGKGIGPEGVPFVSYHIERSEMSLRLEDFACLLDDLHSKFVMALLAMRENRKGVFR